MIDIYDSGSDTFRTRLFGFDKSDVRACVRNLVNEHDEAKRQVERLTARLQATEEPGPQDRVSSNGAAAVQVEKVLASAHKIAEEIRRDAEAAAHKVLTDAQDEAVRLRAQAERDAAALAASATARVDQLNTEIDRMTARRDSLQAHLNEIADALDGLSQQMRNFNERGATVRVSVNALAVTEA